MITEVDDALRGLVRSALGEIDVSFDAPTKDWAARRNAPTVDVYLYDVREDVKRRATGILEERAEDGTVTSRQDPPRHFRLSYLVTAWTQRPEDEHRLLDRVLASMISLDSLPREYLVGSLSNVAADVPVTVGMPPAQDRSVTDVWTSLGGELKPSVEVVVLAPLSRGRDGRVGPPVREPLLVDATDVVDGGAGEPLERHTQHRPPPAATATPVGTPDTGPASAGTARPPRARARRRA